MSTTVSTARSPRPLSAGLLLLAGVFVVAYACWQAPTGAPPYTEQDALEYQAASRQLHELTGRAAGEPADRGLAQRRRDALREFGDARAKLEQARATPSWGRIGLMAAGGALALAGAGQLLAAWRAGGFRHPDARA